MYIVRPVPSQSADTSHMSVHMTKKIGGHSCVCAGLIVVCLISPLFCVPFLPVAYLYVRAYRYYIPAARDSKRLQSVNMSPLVSHFGETLDGAATIRGFGARDR